MGYYTSYNFEVENEDHEKVMAKLFEISEEASYALDEDGDCNETCKWYEHEEDLIKLSKEFPHAVLCLHGEGDETLDEWYMYFKNGKTQCCKAKVTFDSYDEKKLK